MDAKSVRNMYSIIAVTNKHTAKLHHVGSLYISQQSLCAIYTAKCFDIFVSPSDSLQPMPCYVTFVPLISAVDNQITNF